MSDSVKLSYNDQTFEFPLVEGTENEKGIDINSFEEVLRQKYRRYRGLKPDEIDNFFLHPNFPPAFVYFLHLIHLP